MKTTLGIIQISNSGTGKKMKTSSQSSIRATRAPGWQWPYPRHDEITVTPLGGIGEVGMNMTIYGHFGQHIIVDAGHSFPKAENRDGISSYGISPRSLNGLANPAGVILTHTHEDHIGGVLSLLNGRNNEPLKVWATPLCAALLRQKTQPLENGSLAEGADLDIIEYMPGETLSIGFFQIKTIPVSPSVPEACSLFITCGRLKKGILHTGDYNMDTGNSLAATDQAALASLQNVGLVLSDSTNANVATRNSEAEVSQAFYSLLNERNKRVFVACTSSNITRMHNLHPAADATGRRFGVRGSAIERNHAIARRLNYLNGLSPTLGRSALSNTNSTNNVVMLTGSQAEKNSALSRMANGEANMPWASAGDTIVFSSRAIPENETMIASLIWNFRQFGINVLIGSDRYNGLPLHASGHATIPEIKAYYRLARPDHVMPVHGTDSMLLANAEIANGMGIKATIPEPGGVYSFTDMGLSHIGKVRPTLTATMETGAIRILPPAAG